MEHQRLYGADALFLLPLLDGGATEDFEDTPVTIAAGDLKYWTDQAILANPTCRFIGFDSGSTEPSPGDTISDATSGETAVVMFVIRISGTWGGGDAAGYFIVKTVSGAFTNNNNIDNDTTTATNVATVDTAGGYTSNLDGGTAGLFAHVGAGMYAVALTATEMQCKQGFFVQRDATATEEWADTGITFTTFGHESALDPQGCVLTDTANATGQTASNIRLDGDPGVTLRTGFYFEVTGGTGEGQAGFIKTYTAGATFDVVPYVALDTTLDGTSTLKFYRDAKRVPAHLVAGEASVGGDIGTLVSDTAVIESQTTVIESDSVVIESSVQVAESNTVVIESDTIVIESSVQVVESQTTVIESDSAVVESSVQVAESSVQVIESQTTVIESDSIKVESNTEAIHSQTTVIESDSVVVESSVQVAESNSALLDANRGEPGQGAPAASTSILSKIDYLYKAWRNRLTQTSDTESIYDDAGTTVDHKRTVSDDGATYDRGEVASGP